MKGLSRNLIPSLLLLSSVSLQAVPVWAETVQLGKVEFVADTNVKMFKFRGEAKELQSKIQRNGTQLSSLEIRIPVESIKTGMEVRDKHMRERIFTAQDGSTPDVVFKATQSDCRPGKSSSEQTCHVNGALSIRGVERPYALNVTLEDGNKVEGSAVIDVLDFGVKPELLQYAEIRVLNQVNLDFEAKIQ